MRLVIQTDSAEGDKRIRLSLGVVVFVVCLSIMLSGAIGLVAFRVNVFLSKDMDSVLDDVRVVDLREQLGERRWDLVDRKEEISDARDEIQNRIDGLAVTLGEIQAQMFRVNALGQRLTEVSGFDSGSEFDFTVKPGVGGISSVAESYEYPEFLARLDDVAMRLQHDENRLAVLESLLLDSKITRTMFPDAWPVDGGWMSSLFGYRTDPFTGKKAFHGGVDIAARTGSAIQAAAAGVVTYSGRKPGYGMSVKLRHAGNYTTVYAHAASLLVNVGDKIKKGQAIATVGSTGRSTGPHLHFEVLQNSKRVDPKKFLGASK